MRTRSSERPFAFDGGPSMSLRPRCSPRRMVRFVTALVGLAAALTGGSTLAARPDDAALHKEGHFWVERSTGSASVETAGRLKVVALGALTLTGSDRPGVSWSVTKRVRAGSEAEARRLLDQFVVASSREGGLVTLKMTHGDGGGFSADVEMTVPRKLREVIVETTGGAVTVHNLEGDVKAESGGGPMEIDAVGGGVEATSAGGEISLGSIGGAAQCVTAGGSLSARTIGGSANFQTAGGQIEIEEAKGIVKATTAGGNIRIGRSGGRVNASTAGGSIEVRRAGGSVTAATLGGSIEVESADGVSAETGGGSIRLLDVSGILRATTAVGGVYARLATGRTLGESLLSTGAGDITVLIPSNYGVKIQAEAEPASSGRRITSEFPAIQVRTEGTIAIAEGLLDGGGPLLKISVSGGGIAIKRRND